MRECFLSSSCSPSALSTNISPQVLESAAACSPEGVGADLAFLLEMVQKTQARTDRQRQTLALIGTRNILACGHAQAKDAWRDGSGFEASVAAISSLDGAFEDCGAVVSEHHQALFGVIRASLAVLTTALSTVSDPRSSTDRLKGHPPNRRYMRQRIRYKTLACCLLNSGAPSCPPLSLPMVNLLFQMVTEQPGICIRTQDGSSAPYADPNPRGADEMHRIICNADAALVLLHLLPSLDEKLGASVVQALIAMVRTGGYAEMQAMARAGLLRVITSELISTGLAHTHPSGSSSSLASTSVKSTLQAGSLEELLIIPSSSAHIGAFEDEDELSASGYALPDLLHSRRGMGSRAVSAEVENLVLQLLMVRNILSSCQPLPSNQPTLLFFLAGDSVPPHAPSGARPAHSMRNPATVPIRWRYVGAPDAVACRAAGVSPSRWRPLLHCAASLSAS